MNLKNEITEIPGLTDQLNNLEKNPVQETSVLFAKIKLLWNCNLKCDFCNVHRRPSSGKPLSREMVNKLLTELREKGLKKVQT